MHRLDLPDPAYLAEVAERFADPLTLQLKLGKYSVRLATLGGAMVDDSVIEEAGRRLSAAAGRSAQVILFGSHAKGEAGPGSDLDLLVIEPELRNRNKEFVRLREALGDIGAPVDLIVVSDDHVARWGNVRGGVIHQALSEGRVLAGA
jgi:predicted nucleotidyltransferase